MNSPRSSSTNPPRRRSRADRTREGRIKRKRHSRPTPGATSLICTVCGDAALGYDFSYIYLGQMLNVLFPYGCYNSLCVLAITLMLFAVNPARLSFDEMVRDFRYFVSNVFLFFRITVL